MRMVIAQFGHAADRAISKHKYQQAKWIHLYWSFIFNALVYFIPIFLTVYFGADVVADLVHKILRITKALTVGGNMLSALGFAMLLSTMLSKQYFPFFYLWLFYRCLFQFIIIGVTIFAALIAFMMDQIHYREKEVA